MTAKKRRAPGALGETDQDGLIEEAVVAPRTLLAVPSVDELTQLERIVADIVARDIERLCTGPARTLN
jgi:hypothetical protein